MTYLILGLTFAALMAAWIAASCIHHARIPTAREVAADAAVQQALEEGWEADRAVRLAANKDFYDKQGSTR